jgi:hypothetical protein
MLDFRQPKTVSEMTIPPNINLDKLYSFAVFNQVRKTAQTRVSALPLKKL